MAKSKMKVGVKTVGSVDISGDAEFVREIGDVVLPIVMRRSIEMNAAAKGITLDESRAEHAAIVARELPKLEKRIARTVARSRRK